MHHLLTSVPVTFIDVCGAEVSRTGRKPGECELRGLWWRGCVSVVVGLRFVLSAGELSWHDSKDPKAPRKGRIKLNGCYTEVSVRVSHELDD